MKEIIYQTLLIPIYMLEVYAVIKLFKLDIYLMEIVMSIFGSVMGVLLYRISMLRQMNRNLSEEINESFSRNDSLLYEIHDIERENKQLKTKIRKLSK